MNTLNQIKLHKHISIAIFAIPVAIKNRNLRKINVKYSVQ